jgi:hypothetical protein
MLSTVAKRIGVIASIAMAFGYTGTALAAKPDAATIVVAKLYKDFAWQAMATQSDLFGEDLAHQSKVTLEKYFAPALADLLIKDAACQVKYEAICNLDFDILFDSQDPRVTDLDVSVAAPGKVSVVYTDPTDARKTRIDFVVVRVGGAWKISDVVYKKPDNISLKHVLSQAIH